MGPLTFSNIALCGNVRKVYYLIMQWLRARIHPTWLLTVACFGMIAGVALSMIVHASMFYLTTIGGIAALIACAWPRRASLLLIAIGALCFGLVRGGAEQHSLAVYQPLYDKHVVLSGIVSDDSTTTTWGATRLQLRNSTLEGHELPGQIFVTVSGTPQVRRSDHVIVDGVLERGFGQFIATVDGTVTKVSRPVPGDRALEVRDTFASKIRNVIREPEASLGIGYLLGQKSVLPDSLLEALKITGLTHIVVASGYNLTILVRLGRRLFAKVSKYLATLTAVTLIIGFIAVTGLSPSMMRAGLVAGLGILAWYSGRTFHPVTLLGLAAAVTVLINPSYIWGDLGWLLSFAAFAGVMIVAPITTHYFFGRDKVPLLGQVLVETISAQLATLPIMIMAFHQFSAIALVANLLIVPLIPFIMLLTVIAGVVGMVIPAIATITALPAQWLLSLQLGIIQWCADVPWAQTTPSWGIGALLLYLLLLTGAVGYMKWRTKFKLYRASLVE